MRKELIGTLLCLGTLVGGCAHKKPAEPEPTAQVSGVMASTDPVFLEGKGKMGTCQGDADCALGELCNPENDRCMSSYPNPRMLDISFTAAQTGAEECKLVRVYFPYDSAQLVDEAARWVQYDARCLKSRGARELLVEGYADSRGPKPYNQKLSVERAEAVRAALVQAGFSASIKTQGNGERDPIRQGKSEKDYAYNRRVELTIKP